MGVILFFLSFVPYFYLEKFYDNLSLAQKLIASVDFNLAMTFGCVKISQYERIGM